MKAGGHTFVGLLVVLFGVVAFSVEATERASIVDYAVIDNMTIPVVSSACVPLTIAVPRGQYRLTLYVLGMPESCAAGQNLRFTDRVFKPLDCISYAETGKCEEYVADASDICHNWDWIGVEYPGGGWYKYEGSECWDVKYYLAVSSECTLPFNITLTTEMVNLSEEGSEACEGLVDAEKDYKEVYFLTVSFMIFVPVVLICVLAFVGCCFCCPGWPGHTILHMVRILLEEEERHVENPRRPLVYRPSSSYRRLPPRPSQIS